MSDSRCITKGQAAAYCNITPSAFSNWVSRGILPGPIPGTYRWDKKAIDRALDTISGIPSPSEEEDPFEAWRRSRESVHARG